MHWALKKRLFAGRYGAVRLGTGEQSWRCVRGVCPAGAQVVRPGLHHRGHPRVCGRDTCGLERWPGGDTLYRSVWGWRRACCEGVRAAARAHATGDKGLNGAETGVMKTRVCHHQKVQVSGTEGRWWLRNSETSEMILKFPTWGPGRETGSSGELAEKRGGGEGRGVGWARVNSDSPVGSLVTRSSQLSECWGRGCGLASL